MKKSEMVNDKLNQLDWLGEVVDISDPLEAGRVKVKVFGKFDKLEAESIPWASPSGFMGFSGSVSGSGTFSLPKLGSIVNVQFENNNLYTPVYTYIEHLSDELKEEISGDNYETAQVILYDTVIDGTLKMFFTEEQGMMFKLGDSMIRLHRDKTLTLSNTADDEYDSDTGSIVIDPDGNIHLGSLDAAEPIPLGDSLVEQLEKLTARVDTIVSAINGGSFVTDYSGAGLHASYVAGIATIDLDKESWGSVLSEVSNTD